MKLTINDVDYYSQDFDETQKAIWKEYSENTLHQAAMRYQLSCVEAVGKVLIEQLKTSLNSPAEEVPKTEKFKTKRKPK